MKKYLFVTVLILVLVMATGCGGQEDDDSYNSDWEGSLEASQGVQIKDAEDGTVYATYDEDSEIEQFISDMQFDKWETAKLPEGSEKEYYVIFYKQDTIKAGESEEDADGSLTTVGRITTYENSSVITLESLGLDLTFTAPDSALDTIRNAQS